ncbi:MFS transporter [Virgibacillus halodenitrificans]|uniref:CynX/NimT family MFS transporter n=1 Tax=Virgibacillus halodenitrificans TaxID=1482 RepID=UPI00045CE704|nr:MFS transporter [Virgibacillus halodenitrificans]MCG1026807.1 MFS transporter [Virgibacillus halodenitrificans]CDQ30873.1 putative transporter YycB [Virgibacillus halodenitrificans]
MELHQNTKQYDKTYRVLLFIGIIVVAFNLRPAITSIGPLIGIIRDDVGLSNWSVGLLTSLPLIAFAIMSPIVPRLANRYTNERIMMVGLILLAIGISARSISLISLLFAGTLFVGLGIAICNVLLPGVIKDKFPARVALMTSLYSTAMGIFAAAASGLSIPIATGMDLGWKLALLIWCLPAIIGIFIWVYLNKNNNKEQTGEINYINPSENRMWKSPLAWHVAAFMGLQSFLFYVTISWLPEILHDYGMDIAHAGWMLSMMQFIGLPASFFVPVIAGKFKSQRPIVIVMASCSVIGYSGLLLGNSYVMLVISTVIIGIALSGTFALALAFLGMRAKNAKQAAELSGMAQALGYVLAAAGPIFIGYLYDLTHLWAIPLITLIIIALMVMAFGLSAGRDVYVLDGESQN